MADSKMKTRWIIVIGAILVQLCLGAIYAWSAFTTHLQSSKESLVFNYKPALLGLEDAEVKAERTRIFGNPEISNEGWNLIKPQLTGAVLTDANSVNVDDLEIYKGTYDISFGISNLFAANCDAIVDNLKKDIALAESNPKEFDAKLLEAKKQLGCLVNNFLPLANVIMKGESLAVDKGGVKTQNALNRAIYIGSVLDKDGVLVTKLVGDDGKFTDETVKNNILVGAKDYDGFWRAVEKLKMTFKKT